MRLRASKRNSGQYLSGAGPHLDIVPIITNRPSRGEVDRVREQLHSIIGMDPEDAVLISAKYGKGVERSGSHCLNAYCPKGDPEAPLKLCCSFLVRYLPRVLIPHPRDRWRNPQRHEDPIDVHNQVYQG